MTLRLTTIGAAMALAVLLSGTATLAKPARKPVAAARAKPAKPVSKPAAEPAQPDSAASDAAVEPAAEPAGEAKVPDDAAPAGDAAVPAGAAPAPDVPAPEPATASNDAPAAPKKGEPPTHAYMVGVWAEEGKKCETALDFKADGTLIGPFPRWELSETGELTMVGNRQKIMLKVVDKDTMQSRRSDKDPPRILKRCS